MKICKMTILQICDDVKVIFKEVVRAFDSFRYLFTGTRKDVRRMKPLLFNPTRLK